MPKPNDKTGETSAIRAACDLTRKWADQGKLIEGGWECYKVLHLAGASESRVREMRQIFMMGAEHVFTSLMIVLDSGAEASDADLNRMEFIQREIDAFRRSLGN